MNATGLGMVFSISGKTAIRAVSRHVGLSPECALWCSIQKRHCHVYPSMRQQAWISHPTWNAQKSPQIIGNIHYYSSSSRGGDKDLDKQDNKNDIAESSATNQKMPDDKPPEKQGIFQRFKETYKTYGKLLIAVHCATSCVWYGAFYYAAKSGIDVVPLLVKLGASQTIVHPFEQSGLGSFAVAYLLYKLATPARYTVTVLGTQFSARRLRDWGHMSAVPEGSSIRDFAKEGRDKVKQKRDEIKDDMIESRDKARKKAEDFKGDMKDKMNERMQQFKDKPR